MDFAGELALIFVALACGGFLKGAIGAGMPIVAVPVLVLLFDVRFAVAVMVVPNTLANVVQGWQYRADALPARITWAFGLISAGGAVLGAVILANLPVNILEIGVALAVFAYIGFRLARPGWRLGRDAAARLVWPAGVASGLLQGATGISAPVIISYFNAMGLERRAFIATISVSFGLMSAVQIPVLGAYGILDGTRFLYGMLALLPMLGAMPAGAWAARRAPAHLFDRAILGLLAVIAVRMIWRALG